MAGCAGDEGNLGTNWGLGSIGGMLTISEIALSSKQKSRRTRGAALPPPYDKLKWRNE